MFRPCRLSQRTLPIRPAERNPFFVEHGTFCTMINAAWPVSPYAWMRCMSDMLWSFPRERDTSPQAP